MTMTDVNFDALRLRLAVRKAMLALGERRIYREVLVKYRIPWASRAQVEAVVDEYLRAGVFTEEKSPRGKTILVWHDEAIR
jgi:hypothetical protein